MGTDVAGPLRLNRATSRVVPATPLAPIARRRLSTNAMIGIGLWAMLWAGYNTLPYNLFDPRFPASTADLIQGIRSYFPILGGWLALILILARLKRLSSWAGGPLGWVLWYAIVGLGSSIFVSVNMFAATYYACVYLSIGLILLALVLVPDPLPDLRHVLTFTWIVGIVLTLGLLGVIPGLGRGALSGYEAPKVASGAYQVSGEILGMASRNTGFARYAAISALVALARIWEGKLLLRAIWWVLLGASLYALVIANGRTEVLAFVISAFLLMFVQRARRTIFVIATPFALGLLGLAGFFGKFFLYFTRTGRLDITMTGRTQTWAEGWALFLKSPWWGFGFQADRYYLSGQHMHNAFLHALAQAGLLGGGAVILAVLAAWWTTIKHFVVHQPTDKSLIPPEIPGVLLFVTISSGAESTFAYYSAAWLLSAPILAYVLALDRKLHKTAKGVSPQRFPRDRTLRNRLRDIDSEGALDTAPLRNAGEIP